MSLINDPLMPVNTLAGPYPNIVPFSIRETPSITYTVEEMRKWINNQLVPFINENINSLSQAWVDETTRLIENWETISAELVSTVQNIANGVGDSVAMAQTAQAAAEAARDLASMYASTAEEIQDDAISGILADINSDSRQYLDIIFGSKAIVDSLEALINGRLSEESLNLAYADKETQETVENGRLSPENLENTIIAKGFESFRRISVITAP